jgi:uncharacterized membrane protein
LRTIPSTVTNGRAVTKNVREGAVVSLRAVRTLQFLNVTLVALVMGVLFGTWFGLSRSITAIDPESFLEVGRIMAQSLAVPTGVLLTLATLTAIPLLHELYRRREAGALRPAAVGVILMMAALIVTLTVNVPLDSLFGQWTVATIPPDWYAARDRWAFHHDLRTILSIAALGAFLGSAVRPAGAEAPALA